MVHLGQPVLDPVLIANAVEGVLAVPDVLLAGRELDAVVGPVTAKLCILAIWAGIAARSLEAGVLACRNDYRWKALAGLIS